MAKAQPRKLTMPKTKHWTFEIDFEKIGWLTIDTPKAPVNVLSRESLTELKQLVDRFEDLIASDELAGIVLLSSKPSGFIAGADVTEFDDMADYAVLPKALEQTHALFRQIEKLKAPVVVGVQGFCLGGGLELALACHYRIAVNDEKTRIGFPEVKLGIFPGFGGTGRSIRQAGPVDAMQIMLTGRYLRAGAARGMNLVDKLVSHRDQLRWEARKAVMQKRQSKPAPFLKSVMAKAPIRGMIAKKMREEAAKKARPEHYPAPFSLIDLFEEHGDDWLAMSNGEIERFTPLLLSDTSANLRRVFFLSEGLKKQGLRGAKKPSFARVHVIGGGVMGGDIAAWCALRGLSVTLQDLDMDRISPALQRAKKLFQKRLKKPQAVKAAMARLEADVEGKGIARADVIIEAVVEKLEIKQTIFKNAEASMKPGAILATNTSSIELEKIASVLKDKSRLIGLHFFNPVAQLPLVEVIRSKYNSDEAAALGASFALAIGKSPVIVKSETGFLVNRVLMPYMLGAVERVEKGEAKEVIDAAALAFGMPMGPIELMDTVGLDVGKSVAEELGHPVADDTQFAKLLAAKKLGRKTGEGFYVWEKGKAQKGETPAHADLAGLGRELVQPLVDECEKCVAEGIVANVDLADIGVIFGTGFAPFLGGPLKARRDGKV
ncbi:3-hydroxyacyl-CoA dehydrogenase NAD-binding domain-containing protein [Mariluticola halotolerans]|uniref:3-hydroxyacyl-CoA dehydrogenase NAD-binding domain-containing protein n=1 Tax=Mariluticola halotolerans TaxID=2909283 RepID=UPI0026E467DA|nr:3-hydroxyacyl-CoA dehydrogenase NAD-binding domain-containing protein [Mariluticola halotolerans]UJQ94000.1 3-hydroxyacyl-CoA dehydrogenase NAD-binding domain-containing protein [Mariluticola halotolerans]